MNQKTIIEFDLILLAAGKGERMGFKKQFATIGNLPIWRIALDQIRTHSSCKTVIIVFPKNAYIDQSFFDENPDTKWIHGGDTRCISVWNALNFYETQSSQKPYLAIHDAARPILPHSVLDEMILKLEQGEKAVIPVLNASDTIKTCSFPYILGTLKREELVFAQTPQLFKTEIIQSSYKNFFSNKRSDKLAKLAFNPSDDSSLVELNGTKVAVVPGSKKLQKLTIKEDYNYLKHILEERFETRVATGYDVHKFRPWGDNETRRKIMICGVEIEHDAAIEAHSDGDVGIHALCDAIFGCLADGDIGSHFPPNDEKWKNVNSEIFLEYAIRKVIDARAKINFLDITLICELPKIGPERIKMKKRLASICNLPIERISIKATTSETLGFTGRKEGLSAIATVTLILPINTD